MDNLHLAELIYVYSFAHAFLHPKTINRLEYDAPYYRSSLSSRGWGDISRVTNILHNVSYNLKLTLDAAVAFFVFKISEHQFILKIGKITSVVMPNM